MTYPVVIVTWLDAVRHSDGEGKPRHKPAKQIAVGFQLLYDNNGISIADELSGDGDGTWRGEHYIRACDIESVVELEIED